MGEHFVLIHGAWHGGWCWEGVIQELEKAGHTAEAHTIYRGLCTQYAHGRRAC